MSKSILSNKEGFMRLNQILQVIPVSKSTWWAGIKTGRFPKPIKLGGRITAWKIQDINELVNQYNQNQ